VDMTPVPLLVWWVISCWVNLLVKRAFMGLIKLCAIMPHESGHGEYSALYAKCPE